MSWTFWSQAVTWLWQMSQSRWLVANRKRLQLPLNSKRGRSFWSPQLRRLDHKIRHRWHWAVLALLSLRVSLTYSKESVLPWKSQTNRMWWLSAHLRKMAGIRKASLRRNHHFRVSHGRIANWTKQAMMSRAACCTWVRSPHLMLTPKNWPHLWEWKDHLHQARW